MRLRSYNLLKQGIAVAIFFSFGLSLHWLGATKLTSRAATARAIFEEVKPAFSMSDAMNEPVKGSQSPEELKLDDGSIETGVSGNGLIVVNRFTPSAYPSKLQTVRIFIGQAVGQPDPAGQTIRLIAFNGL